MIKSVYIHIPFCNELCTYCDFCKNFYNKDKVGSYLKALKREINERYKNEVLDTIYVGGGTPSCLLISELKTLFDIIKVFKLNNNYEFTFECNYEDITKDLLLLLKDNRVNRISIGLQTFNEKYKKFLGRNINKDEMIKKIKLTKKYFNNINVDLMYGFYLESIKDLENDLNTFLSLNVNHISTYCLIIENHTKLGIENTKELSDDLQNKMYYKIVKTLKENGYNHYEISNFSKKGYESIHNLTYWNNEEYYGFGLGASGFIYPIRYDNTRSIQKYLIGNYCYEKSEVSFRQMLEDEIMLNLRKIDGINKNNFKNKYKKDVFSFFDIKELVEDGVLKENKDNIFIPEDLLFVSNEIIIKVLDRIIINK